VPDIDVVVVMTSNGWHTVEVLHTVAVWTAFAKVVSEQGQALGDPANDFPFGAFGAYVAQLIEI
jgi:hypothetical protein